MPSPQVMGWLGFRRVMPPAEPPLEALEHQAYTDAAHAQVHAFSGHVRGETDSWPDPFGPDPVVFGSEPRVRGEQWG